MRAAILVAACFLVVSSTFAAEPQVQKVASVGTKQVQKAPTAAKTVAPVRVWSVEMSCCEPQ
jgi:hypothetical protein